MKDFDSGFGRSGLQLPVKRGKGQMLSARGFKVCRIVGCKPVRSGYVESAPHGDGVWTILDGIGHYAVKILEGFHSVGSGQHAAPLGDDEAVRYL